MAVDTGTSGSLLRASLLRPRRSIVPDFGWRSTCSRRIPDTVRGPLVLDPHRPRHGRTLLPGEELHLMVSPAMQRYFSDRSDKVHYLTFPCSNEHRVLRSASEHLVTPVRLPLRHMTSQYRHRARRDPHKILVIHMKTMHSASPRRRRSASGPGTTAAQFPAIDSTRRPRRRELQEPARRDRPSSTSGSAKGPVYL